ncbi:MAG: ABC transporter ATP-binding protein [Actinomycetota bacterium]
MHETVAVEAVGLTRTHTAGGDQVRSLHDVSITVARAEVVAVMGPSGSGKSTLLYLLGGLDRPDAGWVKIDGVDWESLSEPARSSFRRGACGFIVQGQALLPQATASENVETPLLLGGVDRDERSSRAIEALAQVGLADEAAKLPDQLSGGQQQRVAIARALVGDPAVLLADEPTGSLDSEAAEEVTKLLVGAARERGSAVVLVTHDPSVASHSDRIVALRSGRLDDTDDLRGAPVRGDR